MTYGDLPCDGNMSHITQSLLAYLLLKGNRGHPREVLADIFWGDFSERSARSCLRTTLWRLRRQLEPDGIPRGTYLVATSTGEVSFNRESEYWLDVEVFETQVDLVLATPADTIEATQARRLESALKLYTGELMEGFYDDWVLRERERLRSMYLNSLIRLMQFYRRQGFYEQSLAYGQKVLDQDPVREDIHQAMIRLYLESGQRTLAMRQYEACHKILAVELGISPMEETQALYTQIAPVDNHSLAHTSAVRVLPMDKQTLEQHRVATQGLEEVKKQLQTAISLVEQCLEWLHQ